MMNQSNIAMYVIARILVAGLFLGVLQAAYAQQASSSPTLVGPVGFNVILTDSSTVEFSWNPNLISGAEASHFKIWDGGSLLSETTRSRWQLSGIDRNAVYDFSVSAVTVDGDETRRSDRVYYDLPQLDQASADGNNAYLPPLENLQAEIIDNDSVKLTWAPAQAHWSWVDEDDYQYSIEIGGSRLALVANTEYTVSGLAGQGLVWLGVSVQGANSLYSRQPNNVLIDTAAMPGTVSSGYPGYNDLYGLTAQVYSSTAAELFWNVHGSPSSANVFVNGVHVARIQEGQSHYLDNLAPGQQFQLSVGEAWPYPEPVEEFAWLLDYDGPLMHAWINTPGAATENLGNPSTVTGLHVEVYSETTAELFWDRSDAVLTRYRIYLDGTLITETNGISWVLNELSAGQNVTVRVVAVGPDNTETQPQEITFSTPDHSSASDSCDVTGVYDAVYSPTSAEVFWDRDVPGTLYELTLDGTVLTTTDATSWYSDSYEPGSTHEFSIRQTAADCQGKESIVIFDLPDIDEHSNQDGNPSKPGNLEAAVYSETAIELFWQRSTDDGWVTGYDIVRDGETLVTDLDATSYFDNTLAASQTYEYSVIAIDNEGNRSEQTTTSVTTNSGSDASIINQQNYQALLAKVFDIYVGDFYTMPIDTLSEFSIAGRNDDGSFIGVFDCEQGSFTQDLDPTGTNAGVFFTFDFDNCLSDQLIYNGYISGQDGARGLNVTTDQFSATQQETGSYASYTGYIQKWISQTAFFDRIHSFDTGSTSPVSIEFSTEDTAISLQNMGTSFAYGNMTSGLDIAWLRGGFETRLPELDNTLLTVSTPIEFSYELNTRTDGQAIGDALPATETVTEEMRNDWVFSTGLLQLVASDGSIVELNADNGNQESVSITLTSAGVTEVYEQPWSVWKNNLRFDNYPDLTR